MRFRRVLPGLVLACLCWQSRLPAQVQPATENQLEPMTPQATEFIRGMALVLLPETYTDDDDWGSQKKIQSGLNVDLDGLKVKTSRRWKEVNHGKWQRVDATLVDPQERFQLKVFLLPRTEAGVPRYQIHASLRLRATGRHQQWALGTKLYSMSADVLADVSLKADLHFRSQITKTGDGSKIRVLPHIEQAELKLDGFNLRRVSHAKGSAVREFGHLIENLIRRAVERKGRKLAAKINGKVEKKPERFEVPAGLMAIFGEPAPPEEESEESASGTSD